MNVKKVEEIVQLMEKHGLTEITIEEEGKKVHLRKGVSGAVERMIQAMPSSPVLTPAAEVPSAPKKETTNLVEIKSPMVGTFYSAPAPDSPPYASTGSAIKEGDILCIIEAMKIMNELKAEVKGKITDVLVENGEPIEFGQVLFLMEPA